MANFHPYSTLHAARIVVNVLKNPEIKEKWKVMRVVNGKEY